MYADAIGPPQAEVMHQGLPHVLDLTYCRRMLARRQGEDESFSLGREAAVHPSALERFWAGEAVRPWTRSRILLALRVDPDRVLTPAP